MEAIVGALGIGIIFFIYIRNKKDEAAEHYTEFTDYDPEEIK